MHFFGLHESEKKGNENWACAFIRGIYINFFVRSVKDNYNGPLSSDNDQIIILRSKLSTTATRQEYRHW